MDGLLPFHTDLREKLSPILRHSLIEDLTEEKPPTYVCIIPAALRAARQGPGDQKEDLSKMAR